MLFYFLGVCTRDSCLSNRTVLNFNMIFIFRTPNYLHKNCLLEKLDRVAFLISFLSFLRQRIPEWVMVEETTVVTRSNAPAQAGSS